MTRDDLTPKTIVDKSATVCARVRNWLNPDSSDSFQQTPTLKGTQTDKNDTFASMAGSSYSQHEVKSVIKRINKHDPTLIPHINKLLERNTLSPYEQKCARENVEPFFPTLSTHSQMEHTIHSLMNRLQTYHIDPKGDFNQIDHENSILRDLKDTVTASWYAATIVLEQEPNATLTDVANFYRDTLTYRANNPSVATEGSLDQDTYWRGVTLLAQTMTPPDDTAHEFIEWIAWHTAPQKVIDLAQERRTTNVSLLKELSGETGKLSAIADGII